MKLSELLQDNPLRVHGNGFLQFDVGDRLSVPLERKSDARIHIWDARLPSQIVDTSIHNHRFGFHSTVLVGTLINIDVDVVPFRGLPDQSPKVIEYRKSVLYNMYEPVGRNGEDTMLVHVKRELHSEGYICDSRDGNFMVLRPGDSYTVDPEEFHLTLHLGTTITFMKKTRITDVLPKIMCQADQTPDNEFDRNLTNGQLRLVRGTINRIEHQYGNIEVPT